MTTVNQAAETLRQYLLRDSKGRQTCFIPEGKFKGWVPRTIYEVKYRKVPKFSEARKLCCNLFKIETKRSNLKVFCLKVANGIANSEDSDQTAPLWVCTVCPDLFV